MNIRYGRAWRKGPTGLETGLGNPPQIVNIAHGQEEIWQLIGFLQREWPDLFRKWLENHPEAHPVLAKIPERVVVHWAEGLEGTVEDSQRTRAHRDSSQG